VVRSGLNTDLSCCRLVVRSGLNTDLSCCRLVGVVVCAFSTTKHCDITLLRNTPGGIPQVLKTPPICFLESLMRGKKQWKCGSWTSVVGMKDGFCSCPVLSVTDWTDCVWTCHMIASHDRAWEVYSYNDMNESWIMIREDILIQTLHSTWLKCKQARHCGEDPHRAERCPAKAQYWILKIWNSWHFNVKEALLILVEVLVELCDFKSHQILA